MQRPRETGFDGWVLHHDSGELIRDGHRVRLQEQPLQILDELLSRPGELVTREQLIARLWPKGVVDFDTGLNSAVRKLRIALHDEAETPRYIETVPRKGYRFIGTIDSPGSAVPASSGLRAPALQSEERPAAPVPPETPAAAGSPPSRPAHMYMYVATGAAVLLLAGLALMTLRREPAPETR